MRKISIQWVFIVILVLMNIWAIMKIAKVNATAKELNLLASSRKSELNTLQKDFKTLKENISLAMKMGKNKFERIPGMDSMMHENKSWLILRVHQNNCNECVIQSLRVIEQSKLSLPVVVLANFPATDGVFTNFGDIKYPVILAKHISLDIPGVSNPYYFVMNENGEAGNIFFPNWKMMDIFGSYVEFINNSSRK